MSAAVSADVFSRFAETARRRADAPALIEGSKTTSFSALLRDAERTAWGLRAAGLEPGERVALMVPPSRDFFVCAFALFRAGLVAVFVDPGLGLRGAGRCLAEAEPAAFIGSPKARLARLLGRWVPKARTLTATGCVISGKEADSPSGDPETPAAILFTSGSTGAPKGAVYTQAMFSAQLDSLREMFEIEEGELSLPTFPLFALFDVALGMTAVIPEMDFTRPGFVDPAMIVGPIQARGVRQLFGSPALLDRVGRYGERHGVALPSLARVMSAGAPVPAAVLARFKKMLDPDCKIFTPYGATEALPVAAIGSSEILGETAASTARGCGVCLGRPVAGMEAEVIRIDDAPIAEWDESLRVRPGAVGEIVVKGPMVSGAYFRRPRETALAKIRDGAGVRHRMGDLGWRDERGRLWFCGRKSQRVRTRDGDLYTVAVEGVFNAHPAVRRSALVGVGEPGAQRPVLCVEREPGTGPGEEALRSELLALGAAQESARAVKTILFHPGFPVDVRHNAKISRETLAVWAARRLKV